MNPDLIRARIDAVTEAKLNELTGQGVRIMREEMPRRTGELRQSVIATPAKKTANGFMAEIVVNAEYGQAVDKGIDESKGQTQTAKGAYMVFDDWPGGPDELRWKDGLYHFKQVRHVSRADHYSERAEKRIRALARKTFIQRLANGIKKILGAK